MTRRDDIIAATLVAIFKHGVGGTSLRIVAHEAQVSLGAITHYFTDRDDVLNAAFSHYVETSVARFEELFTEVSSLDDAREAVTAMFSVAAADRQAAIIGSELYNLALRRPRHRVMLNSWITQCRNMFARFFDQDTTLILDAFYEGVVLHRTMKLGAYTDERIALAVERMTPPEAYVGPGA